MNRCAATMVTPDLKKYNINAISLKIKAKFLTIDGLLASFSYLKQAPGTRSIADDLSGGPSIANKLQRCEDYGF